MKVADFGLSEDVYTTGYFRQGKDAGHIKLPLKWMALESMTDNIFNEKTDVVRSHKYTAMQYAGHIFAFILCSGRLESPVGRCSVLGRPLTWELMFPACPNYWRKG